MATVATFNRRKHSKKRAYERYGEVVLNRNDLRQIINLIQSGNAIFMRAESCSRSHFMVTHNGERYNVVYNKNHHTLHTILPQINIDETVKVQMLDFNIISHINTLIQNGHQDAIRVERITKKISVYFVKLAINRWLKVSYDKTLQSIFDTS